MHDFSSTVWCIYRATYLLSSLSIDLRTSGSEPYLSHVKQQSFRKSSVRQYSFKYMTPQKTDWSFSQTILHGTVHGSDVAGLCKWLQYSSAIWFSPRLQKIARVLCPLPPQLGLVAVQVFSSQGSDTHSVGHRSWRHGRSNMKDKWLQRVSATGVPFD